MHSSRSSAGGPDSHTNEFWDVVAIQGQPVGYQQLRMSESQTADGSVTEASAISELTVRRFGETTKERIELTSRETEGGRLLDLTARMQSGGGEMAITGRRQGEMLRLEIKSGGSVQIQQLPLAADCGGFFAVEWSLRRRPMTPGEQRQLTLIVPVLNQVASVRLKAGNRELVTWNGQTVRRLRIDQELWLPDNQTIQSIGWMRENGELDRTEIPSLGQSSYRTDRETALAAAGSSGFDLGRLATVPLARRWPGAHDSHRARYRIQFPNANTSAFFPDTTGQQVQNRHSQTLELEVRAVAANQVAPSQDLPPAPVDSLPSALIQSTDHAVLALVDQIEPEDRSPWSIAVATEQFVFRRMTAKDYSTAFATAAEVARSWQGDCTEHAVLTAALCRAQQVPARVLIGLVYVESQQGFVFHMWNEVWNGTIWVPIDSTLGRGGTGAAHLIIARSALDDQNPFSSLLPVLGLLGQVRIELLDASPPLGNEP
jgi:transglutaminase-like putative cysteine protease